MGMNDVPYDCQAQAAFSVGARNAPPEFGNRGSSISWKARAIILYCDFNVPLPFTQGEAHAASMSSGIFRKIRQCPS